MNSTDAILLALCAMILSGRAEPIKVGTPGRAPAPGQTQEPVDEGRAEVVAEHLTIGIDPRGFVDALQVPGGRDVLLKKSPSPLMRLSNWGADDFEEPRAMTWSRKGKHLELVLSYSRSRAVIDVEEKGDYSVFELKSLDGDDVEMVTWGPLQTTIQEIIGDTLGVVYDGEYAFGIMALNVKTTGGHLRGPGASPRYTAISVKGGCSLHAFARDRSRTTTRPVSYTKAAHTIAIPGETCEGTRLAIYGVPRSGLVDRVGLIERQEGLHHAMYKGEWLKKSNYPNSSMLFMEYNLNTIDACLDLAESMGITMVYHMGIFKSWGTFVPKIGMDDIRECVARAKERGILLGAHSLSSFIHPHDPLVTPVPHPDLQLWGITTLKTALDEDATTVVLADDAVIEDYRVTPSLNTARIGDELIEYSVVSTNRPYTLEGCKRGAYGTRSSSHDAGARVGRMAMHSYKTFYPDIRLQDQVAKNMANFYNESGLAVMSFDGLEGCRATGHGLYAMERYVQAFYEHLDNPATLSGSSQLHHFMWHYITNEGWGEPWYGGFRESMMDHRFRSKLFCNRNLMPSKLGAFILNNETTVEDVNWVMGIGAGYDGGVDFYVNPAIVADNPQGPELVDTIKHWETARMAGFFTDEQRVDLRNPDTIYRLEPKGDSYELHFVTDWVKEEKRKEEERMTLMTDVFGDIAQSSDFTKDLVHINKPREPGQPTPAIWTLELDGSQQALSYVLRADADNTQPVKEAYFKIGALQYTIPFEIRPGQFVLARGSGTLELHSSEGVLLDSKPVQDLVVRPGKNLVEFNTMRDGDNPGPKVVVNIRTYIKGYSETTGNP